MRTHLHNSCTMGHISFSKAKGPYKSTKAKREVKREEQLTRKAGKYMKGVGQSGMSWEGEVQVRCSYGEWIWKSIGCLCAGVNCVFFLQIYQVFFKDLGFWINTEMGRTASIWDIPVLWHRLRRGRKVLLLLQEQSKMALKPVSCPVWEMKSPVGLTGISIFSLCKAILKQNCYCLFC